MHLYHATRYAVSLMLLMLVAPVVPAQPDPALGLSEAQHQWLNEHPVIRLAPDIAWPPFEWVDEAGNYQGIAADYMQLLEQKLGIRFQIERHKPWAEVVDAVREKNLDAFSCIAKNPQREQYFHFTRPYLSFPMVIITTQEINYIDNIRELESFHVGVVQGYATHEYLAANHPEIRLKQFTTSREGLEAVSQGQITAFIDNIATATRIIQEHGLTNLKITGKMPIRYELSMAVRKDWPELAAILQRALDSISSDQRKEIHNRWISIKYEHGIDYGLLWKSAMVLLLLVVFLYFYNRKLKDEIDHRKLAEQAALQARDEAHRANQAKSEFLSVVSHELRTPLTSIKGALGLLSGGAFPGVPAAARDMIDIANENSDRLTLLINDILDIEKMLAGKLHFEKKPVDIMQLVDKAAAINQGYADQYGVHISLENTTQHTCSVIADASRLLQVISNLVANAIKHSPAGASVRISAECKGKKVRISVSDMGTGVPESFRERIFTPFSQADSSDTRARGGTGLGLAIAKEIIEHHGGSIGYDSPPGQGATFYFELDTN